MIVLLALHTEVGVLAESTPLKLYVVVDVGEIKSVLPDPIEAPAHEAWLK